MDYQASSVTLSQKLSNSVSIYDGVFSSAPSKFVAPTFSSQVEDYTEIFGGPEASRGRSAIPVLEVPELNEQKASVDVRSSKLDYSKVFGGFGDSDFAVPYEELSEEPKKRDRLYKERRTPSKKRSPSVEADPSCSEENHLLSHEASYQSFEGAKQFSMSYHKSNHRSKSFTGGTTLHAVPAYTCMIDEITPLHVTESDKPVSSVANDACPDINVEKGGYYMKATRDHPAGDASKQASGGGVKVQNKSNRKRSNSIGELFSSHEIGHGIHPSNIPPFSSPMSEGKGEFKKPMASMFGVSKSDISEGAGSVHSPPYFDEEVDTNSVAAASAAALKKAIEEAQAKITMAKESMERKKVGLQYRVKMSFENGMKQESRKGVKVADKATISKEKKTWEFHEEVDVPVLVSARPGQETAAFEDADKLTGAKEAEGETHRNESKPTQTEHRQEEADVSEAAEQFYEFADTGEADVSEAAEQFYEFSDTGEPDVPEAAEQFYEFADSNEQLGAALEHKEANNAETMIRFVDEDEQEKEKTTMEVFEIPELGGERLKDDEEEDREVEKIFNAVGGTSAECEEHASDLASAQEVFDMEQNEKRLGAPREHEEIGKLKAAYAKENFEEKPGELEKEKRDNEGLETQELQETKHVKRKLVAPEWVEDEKIGMEACKQEEHEMEQKDVHREEDTERRINKDSRQEIIEETLNDLNDKEDLEKSLKDESESEVNEKLQDTRANEKILEGAACQKKECDKKQKESFEWVESGRMHVLIDQGTEDEKVKVTQGDLKNLDSNFEAEVNLYEQGESEDLNRIQGSTRHMEYDKDVEETPKIPAPEDNGGIIEVGETLIELKENGNKSGSVEEEKGVEEKEIRETDDLAPGVKDAEILEQMEDATEIHSSDKNGINVSRNGISFGQKEDDQLAREPEVVSNLGEHVEELGDINKDMMEAEVTVNKEENKNSSRSSQRKRWFGISIAEVSETLIKLKESGKESEPVEEENDMEEKEICETDGLAPGVRLAEILKQMEAGIETHSSDQIGINKNSNAMNYGQQQDDQIAREPEVACNGKQVDELGEISKDTMEAEGAVYQEENKNNSKSSNRKRWFDNGNKTKAAQLPHMLRSVLLDNEMETNQFTKENKEILTSQSTDEIEENQRATLTTEESETIESLLKDVKEVKKENQATLTTDESKTNYTLQKEVEQEKKENKQEECETSVSSQEEVELEKENLIQKDIAKGRERERQKERKTVERVIREARERAFVEARERAAGTRQRVMAEAQEERLGKTSVQANDNSLAEKASKEAKLKTERAAVERATAEARERALEKALSEKATYEAGKQAKRSVSEKFSGASTDGRQAKRSVSEKLSSASGDNGIKPSVSSVDTESKGSFPSNTSNQGGTNGESAQRSKATLERNQRTAERAAKALAEKNMRDLLVQKEQAERNRLAEALDAEVKRWSSGKERNLRALLSTLQYILGPDSGWQPIPLTDIITAVAVKKAYRKAALFVHPDKLQQRGASIQQKYTCEKVFDLLKEAWNRFNVDER